MGGPMDVKITHLLDAIRVDLEAQDNNPEDKMNIDGFNWILAAHIEGVRVQILKKIDGNISIILNFRCKPKSKDPILY